MNEAELREIVARVLENNDKAITAMAIRNDKFVHVNVTTKLMMKIADAVRSALEENVG